MYYWWNLYTDKRTEEWETEHSSLGQKNAYDMLSHRYMLMKASELFKKPYDINVECMEYFD